VEVRAASHCCGMM